MSLSSSKSTITKSWTTFYVLYTYKSQKDLKIGIRPSLHAQTENEAIQEAKSNLLISKMPNFQAYVIGSKVW